MRNRFSFQHWERENAHVHPLTDDNVCAFKVTPAFIKTFMYK